MKFFLMGLVPETNCSLEQQLDILEIYLLVNFRSHYLHHQQLFYLKTLNDLDVTLF